MKNKTGESIIRAASKQDEPTFTFRAKDKLSLEVLDFYLSLSAIEGCGIEFQEDIKAIGQQFAAWRLKNTNKIKLPD